MNAPILTPVELLHTQFPRGFRGYAPEIVDAFVHRVAGDMETLLAERAMQKERLTVCERELEHFRALEGAMKEALIMAQKAAEETRLAAKAQADAKMQEAQGQVLYSQQKVDSLRSERRRMMCDIRATLNAQLRWLEEELEQEEKLSETLDLSALILPTEREWRASPSWERPTNAT